MSDSTDNIRNCFDKMKAEFITHRAYITENEEAVLFARAVQQHRPETPPDAIFPPSERFKVMAINGCYEILGFYDSNKNGCITRTAFTVHAFNNGFEWSCFNPYAGTKFYKHKNKKIKALIYTLAIVLVIAVCIIIKGFLTL